MMEDKIFFNKVRKYSHYRDREYFCITLPKELDYVFKNKMVAITETKLGELKVYLSGAGIEGVEYDFDR